MYSLKTHFHFIIIPPLLPLMIFFISGIIWQASSISTIHASLLLLAFFIIYIFYKKPSSSSVLVSIIYLSMALSGALLYKKEINDYDDFYHFASNDPLEIIGTITDIAETVLCNKKSTVITLNAYQIKNNQKITTINKNILFYGFKSNNLQVGDYVSFSNVFCKKSKNIHFNHYQIREQIAATIFNYTPVYTIIDRPFWSFKRWVFNQKQRILHCCKHKLSPQCFLFFSSLFLGNRSYVKESIESVNEQFKRWGIYHFLSRSGLHLAVFVLIWQSVLQRLPLPFNIKNIFIIILSIMYA